ncbi:acyl carrier protein [Dactylosporangium vinaceum]|uniref:Acyl carrier protein n=1 Tax=Dactylosporangium vinaceum TaxID=53362 RepID=A0ABV5MSA0_9ACTN|nr:phosphopantetheine-binding protein [Dactylosporangium vinaceum]UAC00205.1 acyl carrier protein [Dactylosporangium vinaceum]
MSTTETTVTARIADIWRELFAEPAMPLDGADNFFVLGASSLLAMAMVERLRAEFGVPVSMLAVTEHPQLAALADHVAGLLVDREQGEL